jgi:hypothetical protein
MAGGVDLESHAHAHDDHVHDAHAHDAHARDV